MKRKSALLLLVIPVWFAVMAETGFGIINGQNDAVKLACGSLAIDYRTTEIATIELHHQKPYGLSDLENNGINAKWPWQSMCLTVGYCQQGDVVFRENGFQLGIGRRLSPVVYFHVLCGVYWLKTINKLNNYCLYPEVGCLYEINESLTLGCRFINPTGSRLKTVNGAEPLLQSSYVGLSYHPTVKLTVYVEGGKQPRTPATLSVGLDYQLAEYLRVLVGLSSESVQPSWGLAGHLGAIRYAIGMRLHPVLGTTTGISVAYSLRKKSWK